MNTRLKNAVRTEEERRDEAFILHMFEEKGRCYDDTRDDEAAGCGPHRRDEHK
jgi:hypothetical protein